MCSKVTKNIRKGPSRYLHAKSLAHRVRLFTWRYLADSNRRTRFCRPIPSRSVKVPFAFAVAKVMVFLIPPYNMPVFISKNLTENNNTVLCRSRNGLVAVYIS